MDELRILVEVASEEFYGADTAGCDTDEAVEF